MGTEIIMESLNNNPNLSDNNRIVIYSAIDYVSKYIKDFYKIDIDLNNISQILSNIKLIDMEASDFYFSYSKEENILVRKKTNDEYKIYDFYNSILRIISQRYDQTANKYKSGLLFDDEKGTHNTVLNEELISRLTTLITGMEDINRKDFIDSQDGTCIKDVVINDMIEIVGFENLIGRFFFANGEEFYDDLFEKIGVEQTMDLISIIDNSERYSQEDANKKRIEARKKYNLYINKLKEMNLETIPIL